MELRSILKRLVKSCVAVCLASLFLSGCGKGDLKADYSDDEVVSFGITHRIAGLDPGISGSVSSALAISKVYECLLQYDYLARPYRVIPQLAEAMPSVSEDGLVYTFKIRKGIYFQDDPCFVETGGKGRELEAADFVFSFKRVADVKNASSGFWAFNRVKGIKEFRDASALEKPTDYSMDVAGFRAPDRYILQIELSEPYPQFKDVLTMHYGAVVPHEAVEFYKKDLVNHPVGTGAYRLVEWKRNSRIEFERNPKWAETGRVETYPTTGSSDQVKQGLLRDAGKSVPFIDRIVEFVVDDQSTAWMMFLSGQLDTSIISRDNWDAVITGDKQLSDSLATRGIRLISSPSLDIRYLGFNFDDPVVGYSRDAEQNERNRKLRQALSCAYDFDRMNKFMNYRLYQANGPVPMPMAGRPDTPSPYAFNLEKAKKLLAEAGYPDGIDQKTGRRLELTMDLGSAEDSVRQRMKLIADMYQRINVVLKLSFNTWPAYLEKLDRRQVQLFELGWVADYPDAENFLQLFYSENQSPGPNHSNYRNPEFDRLYEKVRVMQDCPERTALYLEMAEITREDCPWVFQFQSMGFALVHGWLENYEPHDFPYGMSVYRNINIENRTQWIQNYGDRKLNMRGQE